MTDLNLENNLSCTEKKYYNETNQSILQDSYAMLTHDNKENNENVFLSHVCVFFFFLVHTICHRHI